MWCCENDICRRIMYFLRTCGVGWPHQNSPKNKEVKVANSGTRCMAYTNRKETHVGQSGNLIIATLI